MTQTQPEQDFWSRVNLKGNLLTGSIGFFGGCLALIGVIDVLWEGPSLKALAAGEYEFQLALLCGFVGGLGFVCIALSSIVWLLGNIAKVIRNQGGRPVGVTQTLRMKEGVSLAGAVFTVLGVVLLIVALGSPSSDAFYLYSPWSDTFYRGQEPDRLYVAQRSRFWILFSVLCASSIGCFAAGQICKQLKRIAKALESQKGTGENGTDTPE